VRARVPLVHGRKRLFGLPHRDDGALGDDGKVAVGHDGRDLDDPVALRDEAGHLEVDPDQPVRRHVADDLTRG
jgi:hypothetical protein